MQNLPMEVLRALVTVIDVGGFTQAGELLGRSQPAISLQIKRLEDMLSQKLISRRGKSLELTPAGQTLYDYAKRILSINDEAITVLGTEDVSGSLHLGIPNEFATTLLPKIISRFNETYANVALEVTSDLSKNLLADPERFDLVLALHDKVAKAGKGLIKEDELVWVSSARHNISDHKALPLIAAPDGCIYRNRAIKRLQQHKQDWRLVYCIPDLSGIQAAIEAGLGITVLAKSTVPASLKIIRQSDRLPELGSIGISLLVQNRHHNQACIRLREYLTASLIN